MCECQHQYVRECKACSSVVVTTSATNCHTQIQTHTHNQSKCTMVCLKTHPRKYLSTKQRPKKFRKCFLSQDDMNDDGSVVRLMCSLADAATLCCSCWEFSICVRVCVLENGSIKETPSMKIDEKYNKI